MATDERATRVHATDERTTRERAGIGERIASRPSPDPMPSALDAGPLVGWSIGSLREMVARRGCGPCEVIDYEVALERSHAALEEWRQFVGSVLAAMSEVLIASDRCGLIEKVNPALERLAGRRDDELRGTPLADLLFDDASRERAGRFPRELHLGTVEDCELVFTGADGTPQPFAVNCTPRLSPAGQYVGMVLTGRPVGELRRAYQALQGAHGELERAQAQLVQAEKMASLGRLVAGVAHELNNPISFVLGNVHALARYAQRIADYLEAIHAGTGEAAQLREDLRIDRLLADLPSLLDGTIEGAERSRDIVAGLRQFSAARSAPPAPFDLVAVLDKSIRWVTRPGGSRLAVTVDAPPRVAVEGSAGEMQQVLTNLVQNAVDATEHTRQPRLIVRMAARTSAGGDRIVVTFDDNGPGFDPAGLPHVFEPFYTTKPVGKGLGLGLAISYGIVDRHRGTLRATNRPEGGARVTLELPAPPPAPIAG